MSAEVSPSENRCPRCGAPGDPASAEGLCPRCLVAMNLAPPTEAPTGAEVEETQVVKASPAAPLPLAEVARHFPQLEILDCLGCGGMAAVYKARQPHLNRLVALKILAGGKEQDPAFSGRFTREAQTLARLNHPNIVTLYDFGKVDGLYYLLMEYVDGVSLRQLLHTRKLAPEQALAIVPKICEALQYAHEHGVVHRDIKPENVLLNQEGRVKIADFGIAKMVGGEAGQPALTGDEQVIGTPHYMAPEQVEHPQQVDHRADIYSLGVVFYEMLTGELPLGKFQPPSRKVQVDVRLDEIVLHALAKEPERRYQHASQVKTDVETIASTTTTTAPAASSLAQVLALPSGELSWLEMARWCARLLGLSLLMFMALIIGLYILGVGVPPLALQSGGTLLNYLALALLGLGFIVGWKFEGAAAALIGTGWMLWHSSNGTLAWSMFHIALVVAALYAFYWWAARGRRTFALVAAVAVLMGLLACGIRFLPTNVSVYGNVIDAATRQPIPGAELMVARPPFPQAALPASTVVRSLESGFYVLHVGWYTPRKHVRVTAAGYAVLQEPLGPRPTATRRMERDFVLSRIPTAWQEPGSAASPIAAPDPEQQRGPENILRDGWWGLNYSEKIASDYSTEWLSQQHALLRLGFALYDTQRYSEALEVFLRMEQAADRGVGLVWQGHMLDLLGKRAEAIAAYKKALDAPLGVRHDQYGLVLTRGYVEERLQVPFARVEKQKEAGAAEPNPLQASNAPVKTD